MFSTTLVKFLAAVLAIALAGLAIFWALAEQKPPEIRVIHVETANGQDPWPESYTVSPGDIAVGCFDYSSPVVRIRLEASSGYGMQGILWEVSKYDWDADKFLSVKQGFVTSTAADFDPQLSAETYPDGAPILLDLANTGLDSHLRLAVSVLDGNGRHAELKTEYYKFCPTMSGSL